MSQTISLTPEQLQEMLREILKESHKLNALDQRKYDEMLAKERRRDDLAVQLGKAEEEATRRRKDACTHLRYPAGARYAGHMAPKGTPGAEWRTGGQAYQNGMAMLFCMQCASNWWFKPTPEFLSEIQQVGMFGMMPPPDDQCYCIGCYRPKNQCKCVEISREYVNAHPTVPVAV